MTDAELVRMARNSGVKGFDESALLGQVDAYQYCCKFLSTLEKRQTINRKYSSYGYKHMVEDPSGRFGGPNRNNCYTTYVYEGTFILAAIAHGFEWKQDGSDLKVAFNISERSLKETIRRLTSC
jgi:hypothetical protein